MAYGFDVSLTNFEGMGPKLLPETAVPTDDGEVKTGRIWEAAESLGGPVSWTQRSKVTGGFADAAIQFIDSSVKKGKPFYVNVWPDDVHTPLFPSVANWSENKRERYLAVLEEMDRQFASLFERVRSDPKLVENTLILICSDNGPEKGAGTAGKLKGYKTHLYEGGIRSSLVVWGPRLVDKKATGGRNTESVFSAIDLVPSLFQLVGVELSSNKLDGEDMLGTLLGKAKRSRTSPLFFSRPPDRKNFYGFENLPDLAVRDGKWKLLCDYDGSRAELYDLSTDPEESRNIAAENPEIASNLCKAVVAWYSDVLDSNR